MRMTKEEAKEWLDTLHYDYNTCEETQDVAEAIRMAIQALEKEPCEDAVSRKALMSHIENQSREWGEDYDTEQILSDIEDFPSVTPTPNNDALDKIRAEIVDLGQRTMNDNRASGIWACRDIIDKYKDKGVEE